MTHNWLKSWLQLSALAGGVLLGACVFRTEHKVETTHKIDAHIVLDIRQVNADLASTEDYVRGDDATTSTQPTSMLRRAPREYDVASLDIAGLFVSRAHAAEGVSDADRQKALDARKARNARIDAALTKKVLGENYKGYVEPTVDKKHADYEALKQLADQENKDRRTIYLAIAQNAGGNESNLPQIEASSALTIREKSLKKGQLFQAPKDKKAFDEFAASDFGKGYPGAKPEAWLEKK